MLIGVQEALGQNGLWPDVFETLLKVTLVSEHTLNAEFLHGLLARQQMAARDPYWSYAAYHSLEKGGAVRSLLTAAHQADVSRWPQESRWLAGVVLSWLCAAADRRVRDRASRGLTRLLRRDSELCIRLIAWFADVDDEYIKERVLQATYSALLLNPNARNAFANALEDAVCSAYDTPNVLIRDCVRLIAERLGITSLSSELQARLKRYPTRCSPLKSWYTKADTVALTSIKEVPLNMDLLASMEPDFARYIVEPHACSRFDLEKAGVSYENVMAWLMVEVLNLGYPGLEHNSLAYDHEIISKHGAGRGKPAFAETLGKKYLWIALHRLVGLMADTLPVAESYSGYRRGPSYLWSRDLRDVDLTDFRDVSEEPPYLIELLGDNRYDFAAQPSDDTEWAKRSDDFSPHADCLLRMDSSGNEWVTLTFYATQSDREDGDDALLRNYRHVSLFYSSIMVSASFVLPDGAELREVDMALEFHGNSDYRGFLAEYPDSIVFRQAIDESDLSANYPIGERTFKFSHIDLLRGGEWEYDFSGEEKHANLRVPTPELVHTLDLQWDEHSGWTDVSGALVAVWLSGQNQGRFLMRRDSLDQYLKRTKQAVLLRRFVRKSRFHGVAHGPQIDALSYLRYSGDLEVLKEESRFYEAR